MKFWRLQKRSLALLDERSRRRFIFAIIIQTSLSFLDIAGVILSGVIGVMASTSLTHTATPKTILRGLAVIHIEHQTTGNQMITLSFLALGFFLAKNVLALYFTKRTFRFLAFQQSRISSRLVSNILESDYIWLRKQDPHVISMALIQGVSAATVNSLGQVMLLAAEMALVILFLLLLFLVNPLVAIFTVIYMLLVLYAINSVVGKRVTAYAHNLAQLRISSQVNLFNALKLFREIRILRRVTWFEERIDHIFAQQARNFADDIWSQQIPKYALEVAMLVGASGLLVAGKISTNSQHMVPLLAIYLAGATRIVPSLLRMQSSIFSLRSYSSLSARAFELIDSLRESEASRSEREIDKVRAAKYLKGLEPPNPNIQVASHSGATIKLSGLSFRYPNSEKNVLQDLSFEIAAGERVAIVGPSGAGKSTLCDLFLGLLDPTEGVLEIGAVPAAQWIEKQIGKVSYLPQEITLISGTLLENICLGMSESEIDFSRVDDAIYRAQLSDFVTGLPQGLNSNLGIGGAELSGGQKQRIGIARALYPDPAIVVMDESTSSLDAETEHEVMNVLESLREKTTVIFIAHRLSSIRNFPRVMYFEDGLLVGDGTFSEVRDLIPRFDKQVRLLGL